MDYLDSSFGAAAGHTLTVLPDDIEDLDQSIDAGRKTPTPSNVKDGIIDDYNGETIRILPGESIKIIENYFENIKPEDSLETVEYVCSACIPGTGKLTFSP